MVSIKDMPMLGLVLIHLSSATLSWTGLWLLWSLSQEECAQISNTPWMARQTMVERQSSIEK